MYLEAYTSILIGASRESLQALHGKEILVADREFVEREADTMLSAAEGEDVAFLVVGDPFGATTHTDLYLRAVRRSIPVQVVHNASIMNAVGACGLQLYHYGPTVSIPFFTATWRPDSFYDKILANKRMGWHTLCLLDIKVREQTDESLFRGGKKIYAEPRFMTVKQALQQLVEVEAERKGAVCTGTDLVVAMMRVGSDAQAIVSGTVDELLAAEDGHFGGPLHSLIIPGAMHAVELEMLRHFALLEPNKGA